MTTKCLMLLFVVLYYSAVVETAPNETDVPPPFKDYTYSDVTKMYYRCYDTPLNFTAAIQRCRSDGAELGVPKTKLEFDVLKDNFKYYIPSVWLALTDLDTEGQFKTLSGLSVDKIYTNWDFGEPNDGGFSANEDCSEMLFNGKYEDIKCDNARAFICTKPLIIPVIESKIEASTPPSMEFNATNKTPIETVESSRNSSYKDRNVPLVQQPAKFRKDYEYDAETGYYYKVHAIVRKNFSTAVSVCKSEGSQLAIPKSLLEVTVLNKYAFSKFPKRTEEHWVGIHDSLSKGNFLTLDGVPVNESYVNWKPWFPDSLRRDHDCVSIDREGFYYEISCAYKLRFVCTKHKSIINFNILCDTHDSDYFVKPETDKCYKLHTTALTWHKAFQICRAELANLVEIKSATEAQILAGIFTKHNHENINKTFIHVDFSDHVFPPRTFLTSKYERLAELGYEVWDDGEPDNKDGDEHCGGMMANGKLADVNCNTEAMFFCEKNLPK